MVATKRLTFDVEVPNETRFNDLLPRDPRFLPVIRTAEVDIQSLQKIAQTSAPANLVYDTTYLHNGFEPANGGKVFLARDSAFAAVGGSIQRRSERSGGLVAPTCR